MTDRLSPLGSWALVGVLFVLVAITLPELGSDPWRFRPGAVDPQGPLAPLVRAAGEEWDLGIPRAAAFVAALLCGATAIYLLVRPRGLSRGLAIGLIIAVGLLLTAPATLLQLGLRDSTAPWFFTNDSTYQIELGGELLLDLDNPYGHDYRESGLERFYTRDGSVSERVREREVALEHFAYFPGAVVTAAVWRLLPEPFDDYRLLVLFCNLGMLAAALAFRGPLAARLALGALLVCNPIAVRSAWFGQNDAPSLLLLVLAFALASRRRFVWAAAALGGAVLLKQFALVAAPFLALMMVRQSGVERRVAAGAPAEAGAVAAGGQGAVGSGGVGATAAGGVGATASGAHGAVASGAQGALETLRHPALAFLGVLAVGIIPFLVAGPVAFYEDTIRYGAGTYRIVGYGLSAILVEVGIIDDREGAYPFAVIALLTWVPLTVWLLLLQRRAAQMWIGAAAFAVSILWLMFIGRTFNNYYLVWPMTGAVAAALLAVASPRAPDRPEPG
jgi:hypothetical protein